MNDRRRRSVGRHNRTSSKKGSVRGSADLIRLLRDAGRPLSWPAIRDQTGTQRGDDVDDLRRLLRELCRTGELYLDEAGAYHVVAGGESVTGVLESGERRGQLVFCAASAGEAPASAAPRRWPVRRVARSALREGDRVSARIVAEQAVVSDVIEHSPEPVIGRLVAERRGSYVVSESPGFRGRVYVLPDRHGDASDGDTVAARVLGVESYGLTGEIVQVVVRRDELHVASTTLLQAYNVPTVWPDAVLDEVGGLPDSVDRSAHGQRIDLTDLPLVTIDGADARDFDDAVFCEPRRRGGWRLVVAIADVAHYVEPESALDTEAATRGNSVYLPDRVVPMLPEALSNELCSLKPQEYRLCMVCDMHLSAQGRVTEYEFYEAVMLSAQRLTYSEVAGFLDGGALEAEPAVHRSLMAMHAAYKALLAERSERGALDFDTRELRLVLENGLLERIEPVVRNDAHRLIEEAMISANVCAARFLEKHKRQALYRVHEGPTGDKLEDLRQALALVGVRLSAEQPTPKALQQIVASLAHREDRWLYEMLVLRSMSQAVYHPKNIGHFGLALPRYMHFTSPIRRYADLVVHRALKDALQKRRFHDRMPWLLETGERISDTERRAEEVSRGVADWLKCEYATRYVGVTFKAQITGVAEFGLFSELADVFVQGMVHVSNLGEDFFEFHPGTMSLVGERTGRRFQLGDTIDVVLAAVDPESRKIDLLLAPEAVQGKPGGRRRGRRRR
jgi:ribonuclease R